METCSKWGENHFLKIHRGNLASYRNKTGIDLTVRLREKKNPGNTSMLLRHRTSIAYNTVRMSQRFRHDIVAVCGSKIATTGFCPLF